MSSPRKGTVVDDRYRLEEKIGSGGMADVWLAEDTDLDRKVAIKILHERFTHDEEFVERFRREAQSAAGLQHPNVVGIFDRGDFGDTYFIAMEYVDGPSLKDLVKGGMATGDAIEFTRQILKAARFAHRKGIVHRDLKPQNVLIDDEGRARVADFGIARAGGTNSDITQTGSVMGTAQYLPPEQAQGRETTPQSDLYSIGVILYEALTGRVPFEADTAVAVALKQVSETPRRPSAINPSVPPALDAVVMRALAKEPEQRFVDADAFLKALDAAEAAPDSVAAGDTASYAAIGVDGSTAAAADDADYQDYYDERDRRNRRRWLIAAVLVALVAGLVAYFATRPVQTDVPDVVGDDVALATALLEGQGFDVDQMFVNSSTAERDMVTEQNPVPTDLSGEQADEGSTVTLTVSLGPSNVEIPDVSNLNEKAATAQLEEEGFVVTPRFVFARNVPKGRTVRTEPGAGTVVPNGSSVDLLISKGSNTVQVPDLIGLQEAEARSAIENADLSAIVRERDDPAPEGEVVSQAPPAGTELKKGDEVTIFVSSGVIEVPDVIGMIRKEAANELKRAGFVVAFETDPAAAPSEDGRVVDQFPPAGSNARRGDTVTIVIGDPPAEPEPAPVE